jgi:hypothetical protein
MTAADDQLYSMSVWAALKLIANARAMDEPKPGPGDAPAKACGDRRKDMANAQEVDDASIETAGWRRRW